MAIRTLSPVAPSPGAGTAAPGRRVAQALVVVTDVAGGATPDPPAWVDRWCRGAGWERRTSGEVGPGAAVAAARPDVRVLLLRRDAAPPDRVPRVVAALRGLPDDATVVADAATCAARLGGRLTLVHAVPRSFGERSVGLPGAVTHGQRLLDVAADRVTAVERGVRVDGELLRVRPHELVGGTLDADLLVVGGPRTDRSAGGQPRSAGVGLVAHSALHHAACPVLLTPR